MATTQAKKTSFSKTYAELQKVVEWFEGSESDLEEGIKKFEAGMKLAAELTKELNTMENKIKELKKLTH